MKPWIRFNTNSALRHNMIAIRWFFQDTCPYDNIWHLSNFVHSPFIAVDSCTMANRKQTPTRNLIMGCGYHNLKTKMLWHSMYIQNPANSDTSDFSDEHSDNSDERIWLEVLYKLAHRWLEEIFTKYSLSTFGLFWMNWLITHFCGNIMQAEAVFPNSQSANHILYTLPIPPIIAIFTIIPIFLMNTSKMR